MLASRGIDPFRIQSLGRWKSPLVVHYAGESLSTGLAGELSRALPSTAGPDAEELAELRRFVERLEWRPSQLQPIEPADRPTASASAAASATAPALDILVLNRDSGAIHRNPAETIHEKKSYCGWYYAARADSVVSEIPAGISFKKICNYCLRTERELARAEQLSDPE